MWISSKRVLELVSHAATEAGNAAALRQQLAVQQQNFDWLANHVNRLEIERSQLLARIAGIGVVAPQIVRDPTPQPPGIIGGIPVQDRPEGEEPGMALAAMQSSSFEDMGDAAAQQFGVQHDPKTGSVIYTR
jgi:hypothetical protein